MHWYVGSGTDSQNGEKITVNVTASFNADLREVRMVLTGMSSQGYAFNLECPCSGMNWIPRLRGALTDKFTRSELFNKFRRENHIDIHLSHVEFEGLHAAADT